MVAALAMVCSVSAPAAAFCGFYVSGADAKLYNNATMVVMMRDGTRTVLSMQNNYQGPPENFAMVVPVPVVLQKENVKTLPADIFDRVDALAAPRLVEYWEQDPCQQPEYEVMEMATAGAPAPTMKSRRGGGGLGVTIEAQFKVGEYEIVILSAKDSTGLDTWLRQNKYKIPEGAEPLLRPYVASGMKFFVAKVDVEKVEMKDGQASLSPLRFHYDSKEFALPVRLGLVNSSGTQDLLVHILARGQRYDVANFENVTIPTNINVDDATRERFGEFYAALFDATLEKNPGAVITEYSWDAATCDPCPTPALNPSELATLGADVLPGAQPAAQPNRRGPPVRRIRPFAGGFVLTRLHARYGTDSLGEDLVFKAAPPIAGGREFLNSDQKIEKGSVSSSRNMFQGRYAIRHEWTGAIECENPVRGRWGGPPNGGGEKQPRAARDLAFVPRGKVQLARLVEESVPEIDLVPAAAAATEDEPAEPEPAAPTATTQGNGSDDTSKKKKGCGGCATRSGSAGGWLLVALVLGLTRRRRG